MSRVPCIVPGCRRTRQPAYPGEEYICAKHYGPIPRKYKDLYSKAKRRYRKTRSARDWRRCFRIWKMLKDAAVARAWSV